MIKTLGVYSFAGFTGSEKQLVRDITLRETEAKPYLVTLDPSRFIQDEKCEYFALRPAMVAGLDKAACALARKDKGLRFKIYETYRSSEKQIAMWEKVLIDLAQKHPDWTRSQLETEANNWVANPYGMGSAHQMGAAVDISICDTTGKPIDMGDPYLGNTNKTPTNAQGLTSQQYKNRKLLTGLMALAGLANYPGEWWHYCLGDGDWALCKGKKRTLYAPIPVENLQIVSHGEWEYRKAVKKHYFNHIMPRRKNSACH